MPQTNKRPTSVKIGPVTYTIVYNPKLKDLGRTDHANSEISVRDGISKSLEKETLVHEALHGIWYLCGLDEIKKKEEETLITVVSPWVLMFWSDPYNKDFVEYVTQ